MLEDPYLRPKRKVPSRPTFVRRLGNASSEHVVALRKRRTLLQVEEPFLEAFSTSSSLGALQGAIVFEIELGSFSFLSICVSCSLELLCFRLQVNAAAEANWKVFAADGITEMTAHLMAFPVQVRAGLGDAVLVSAGASRVL